MVCALIAVAGAFVLARVLRRSFFGYSRFGGYGPSWMGAGCGMHRGWAGPAGTGSYGDGRAPYRESWRDELEDDEMPFRRSGRHGGGFFLNALLDRIEATPAQAKAIRDALDELRAKGRGVKEEARATREDLAKAFRGESLEAETLGAAAARTSDATEGLRDAAIGALLKVHTVLEPRQREIIADALSRGPFGWRRHWGR